MNSSPSPPPHLTFYDNDSIENEVLSDNSMNMGNHSMNMDNYLMYMEDHLMNVEDPKSFEVEYEEYGLE